MNHLIPVLTDERAHALTAAFLAGRSVETVKAYRQDLADFAAHLGACTTETALLTLLSGGPGSANELGLRWKADMLARELAPATINRRLAALRSVVKLARTLGMVSWSMEVGGVRSRAYRDTRGPGVGGVRAILQRADTRDRAI